MTSETISNAPAGSEAWNGTYQWDSKMHLAIEPGHLKVTVRIFTSASEAVRAKWTKAIADKWSDRMDFQILSGTHAGTYPISVGLEYAATAADADYTVAPNAPGATEEYFTTNGTDYTQGGTKAGFRDAGAGVMNNPADVPFERHYAPIGQNAAELLGLAADAYKIAPHQAALPVPPKAEQPKGGFPVPSKDANQAPA